MKIGSLIALVLFVAGSARPADEDRREQPDQSDPAHALISTSLRRHSMQKGNSSTDDTAAIQAALDGGLRDDHLGRQFSPLHPIVLFPPGIYRVRQLLRGLLLRRYLPFPVNFSKASPVWQAATIPSFLTPASVISVIAGRISECRSYFPGPRRDKQRTQHPFQGLLAVVGYNEAYWLRSTSDITFDRAPSCFGHGR